MKCEKCIMSVLYFVVCFAKIIARKNNCAKCKKPKVYSGVFRVTFFLILQHFVPGLAFARQVKCRLYTMREVLWKRGEIVKKNPGTVHSVQDMIRHIRLICEKVFSHFLTNLSTKRFFGEMSKEFFIWHQQFIRNSSPAIHYAWMAWQNSRHFLSFCLTHSALRKVCVEVGMVLDQCWQQIRIR